MKGREFALCCRSEGPELVGALFLGQRRCKFGDFTLKRFAGKNEANDIDF